MIADGDLVEIRLVATPNMRRLASHTPLENTGQKQAGLAPRTRPQSGPGGSLGRHRHARLQHRVLRHRIALPANSPLTFPFLAGAVASTITCNSCFGLLKARGRASGRVQVANRGNANNLRLRVYGEKAGLEWHQEEPTICCLQDLAKRRRYSTPSLVLVVTLPQRIASRIPGGHPEGYLEASRSSIGFGRTDLCPA